MEQMISGYCRAQDQARLVLCELEAGEADAAVQAAVNVLKKNHPELLSSAAETIVSGG